MEGNQVKGEQGEDLACSFLLKKGYQLLARNFRTRWGEIDLVMADGKTIVFVEVKRRDHEAYGKPEEAVTIQKTQHMVKAALMFVKSRALYERPLRFDVLTVSRSGIRHCPDAFWADGAYYY